MSNLELIKELELLDNDKYVSEIETQKQKKQSKKEIQEAEKEEKLKLLYEINQEKLKNIKEKQTEKIDDTEYTELHGKTKLENQNLIKQYLLLFSSQLQDFKYKKNGTNEQLIEVINEIRAIVEIGTVDSFVMNSVYDTILMLEPYSKPTRFNVVGLSNALKLNPNFNNLCKQVMLKHNIGSSMSPEMQLLMITTTTIYMTIQKNNNKSQIDQYLNQKI